MAAAKRYPYWVPYVLPYLIFLAITLFAEEFPGGPRLAYPARLILTLAAVAYFFRSGDYPELEFRPSLLGIGAGVVGFAFWVYPEHLLSWLPKIGESSFDPDTLGAGWRDPVLAVRLVGAVVVVPVFEELFLRSFLLRWVDLARDEDFASVPIGRYRLFSFAVVVAAMALTHHRWLRAGLYSAMLCLVLYREKRMGPVIWAHAVTNLLLGIYVLRHEAWFFW